MKDIVFSIVFSLILIIIVALFQYFKTKQKTKKNQTDENMYIQNDKVNTNENSNYNLYNSYTNYDYFTEEYEDSLYNEIVDLVIRAGKVSASLIQRKYRLSYNRAARIIDLLEERGIIGPPNGSKPREVLIKSNNCNEINNNFQNTEFEFQEILLNKLNIKVNYETKINLNDMKNLLITNSDEKGMEELLKFIITYTKPNDLKLVIIDYSRVNFLDFNGLSNLLAPVVTTQKLVSTALLNCVNEMNKRYSILRNTKTKNITSYNQFCEYNLTNNKIPYIFIIINEAYNLFSDDSLKNYIAELLMNGNNVGINLIMFSKFNKKNIKIGILEDLINIQNTFEPTKFFSDSKELNYKAIDIIDNEMNGFDFEKYTKILLKANGFNEIMVTKASNDFGVDVIAYKDEVKYAIQCKKYSSSVGIKAVQEIIASKAMNNCHVAAVLTNSIYTKSAKELANKNNVLLWDRTVLLKMIKNIKKDDDYNQLRELKSLYDDGVITQDEFEKEKQKILN